MSRPQRLAWHGNRLSRITAWLAALVLTVLATACAPNVEALEAERDLDGLVEALGYADDADVRLTAAEALGRLQEPAAVPPLVAALVDHDPDVRSSVVGALGELRGEASFGPMLGALGDEAAGVRGAAVLAVAGYGDPAAVEPILEVAAEDADAEVRRLGSGALDRLIELLGSEGASAALVDALQHDRSAVRIAAAHLLASHGTEAALIPLLVAADDPVAAVRRAVQAAFDQLSGSAEIRAGSSLIEALEHELIHVRQLAAEAIGIYGGSSAVPALIEALHDTDVGVRVSAVEALGLLGDSRSIAPLLLLDADPAADEGAAAIRALNGVVGRLRPDAAVATLHELTTGEERLAVGAERLLEEVLAGMQPEAAVRALFAADASDARLASALDVSVDQVAAELTARGWWLEELAAIHRGVSGAANGNGATESRVYEASTSFHAAVFVGPGWPEAVETWRPAALRFTELVVVADEPTTETVEVCDYVNPDGPIHPKLTRVRELQRVRILAAHDGTLISERWFSGSYPRPCQETEIFTFRVISGVEMPEPKTVTGDPVDLQTEAVAWARGFVNPRD